MENKDRLQKLLKELFQFDNADLDFGIYRIMNKKHEEIENFINHDLINYIEDELSTIESKEKEGLEKELERVKEEANNLGIDYTQVPKYQEIKEEMAEYSIEENLESNIYNDIYTFFKRYYDNGDFLSKRRYSSQDKYAIPYNGEEVYLHWANNDQYYIKTSEEFNNYSFSQNNTKIYFQIKNAEVEKNNNKSDEDRYFVLKKDNFFEYNFESNVLKIYFEYRNLTDKEKSKYKVRNTQSDIREYIEKDIQEKIKNDTELFQELNWLINDSNKVKSLLAKHLYKYTVKNKSDYFIHKDLKGFLERELDFFIKNEIFDVDTIGTASDKNISAYMTRIKVIKEVCQKIIDFLAQIENFQKKLFEKKKFVLQDEYCLTLDKVPSEIRDKIFNQVLKNEDQLKEWEELYGENVEKIKDLYHDDSNLFDTESLKKLVVDTRYFNEDFKEQILTSFNNLEEEIEGLMINSENYQALNLMLEKYRDKVKCIYIDPPYNTGGDEFVYKDNYQHSSWLTMMENRLNLAFEFLADDGVIFVSIDDNEVANLRLLLEKIFNDNMISTLIWKRKKQPSFLSQVGTVTEYILVFSKNKNLIDKLSVEKVSDETKRVDNYSNNISERIIRKGIEYKGDSNCVIKKGAYKNKTMVTEFLDDVKIKDGITQNEFRARAKFRNVQEDIDKFCKQKLLYITASNSFRRYASEKELNRDKAISNLLLDWGTNQDSNNEMKNLFSEEESFSFPKPLKLIKNIVNSVIDKECIVMDFFAGSGTTGHACLDLNKEDDGQRKYIQVELGDYFYTTMLPRIKKVMYSQEWKDGKPQDTDGYSHFFKYQNLEQYEDSLDNIIFAKEKEELNLFNKYDDYLINYMLDYETKDSLIDLDKFSDPFNYYLEITEDKEKLKKKVDLVETFNYLIGLEIKQKSIYNHQERKFKVIFGEKDNKEIAVIWRNTEGLNFEQEKKFIEDEIVSDKKIDKLYLNGDNYLEDSILIEDQFNKRLFSN